MADLRPCCIECVMTWLMFGDGAICLACKLPVVWKGVLR